MLEASCHCGAVRIEMESAPTRLTRCTCTICHRYGSMWAYYPANQVKIHRPPEGTAFYVWGDRTAEFHFCRTCGCLTHYEAVDKASSDRVAVNARMIDPALIDGVELRKFDGRDTWKPIEAATVPFHL